jgi:hypothetical protein
MHFLNNATIVVLASTPSLQATLSDPEAPPPLWLVPAGAVAALVGVRLLLREPGPVPTKTFEGVQRPQPNPNEEP